MRQLRGLGALARLQRVNSSTRRFDAEPYGLVLAWGIAVIVFTVLEPNTFPTVRNFQIIFSSQTVLLILTLALVISLSAGEFDLSVGAVLGITQTLTAYLTLSHGWPIGPVIVFMLAIGIAIGLINALFIVRFGVSSLVMTLGMSTLLLGLSIGIASPEARGIGSQSYVDFVNHLWLGLPLAWYFALLLTVAIYYMFDHTPLGRYIRFVGANREVARLTGLPVDRIRVFALVASSAVSVFAGLMLVGLQGAADITAGTTFLLPAFAGAFLGATAITPGRFNAWGSFAAVYFLVTGITGLELWGLSGWVEEVFYGGSLIVAVTLSQLLARRNVSRTSPSGGGPLTRPRKRSRWRAVAGRREGRESMGKT